MSGSQGRVSKIRARIQFRMARDTITTTTTDCWNVWRGPPGLVAHIAAAGIWCLEHEIHSKADCLIDILVLDDHERYCSPADFAGNVTQQALRRFRSITIALSGEDIRATFRMRWRRSWWRFGRGPESEVTLLVEGTDAADVELLRQALHPAVCRGTGIGITVAQGAIGLLLMMLNAVAFALITILTIVSAAYVLKFDPVRSTNLVVAGLACGFILGAWAASWAFPSLEVADHRQSHVWRLVKAATPVVLPILLAGLTKLVYR